MNLPHVRFKNQKPVRLPLHQEVLRALEILGPCHEYIFWSGDGNAKSCVGDWQRSLRRLSVLSGVNITAHRVEKHYSQWIDARQKALDAAVKLAWT